MEDTISKSKEHENWCYIHISSFLLISAKDPLTRVKFALFRVSGMHRYSHCIKYMHWN